MDWTNILIILQLIFLEGILSIDNAAVLGAMVASLPSDQKIPWPKSMARTAHHFDRLFGMQRLAALRVGLLGAYLGRGLMLVVASAIVDNPWLKLIGGAYLIRLALEDLGYTPPEQEDEEMGHTAVIKKRGFWATVLAVELMDLAFSLDNVVAAVSLSSKLWVVVTGVAIGILTMRYAAGIFSYLIEKEPVLQKAAYILIFNIGIELFLEDLGGVEIADWMKFTISISTIALALAYEHLAFMKVFRPLLMQVSRLFGALNQAIDWILLPFGSLFRFVWRIIRPSRRGKNAEA